MEQGLIAQRQAGLTLVKGRLDGRTHLVNRSAATALQRALNSLEKQGGGQLLIESGVYELEAPLRVPSTVWIFGRGRTTVLKLSPLNKEGVLIIADAAESVVVSDLTCQGIELDRPSAGIVLDHCGDCEVRNVNVRDFSDCGIWVRNNSFMNKLTGNTTYGNSRAGTLLEQCAGGGRGGDWVPNLVSGCTSIGEEGHAFELEHAVCVSLAGCVAYQPGGHGFYLHDTANSAILTGCRCYQGERNGLMVQNSHELNASGNIFCWNRGHGIELNHVTWGVVTGNEVIDSGGRVEPQCCGIYMHTDTKGVQVTGNAVFNWQGHLPMQCGILEAQDCRDNQIIGNFVNHFTEAAVSSTGRNSVAENNLGVREAYIHPGPEPFPLPSQSVQRGRPFEHDRVVRFLKRNRR